MNVNKIETPKLKEDLYKAKIARSIRTTIFSKVQKDESGNPTSCDFSSIFLNCDSSEFDMHDNAKAITFDVKKGFKGFVMETIKNIIRTLPVKAEINVIE